MRRGTTPAIVLEAIGRDLTQWKVYVTLKNESNLLTLENDDLTMTYSEGITTIAFSLTQEQTLAFDIGTCEVEIRAIHDGTAVATEIGKLEVNRILLEGVINE